MSQLVVYSTNALEQLTDSQMNLRQWYRYVKLSQWWRALEVKFQDEEIPTDKCNSKIAVRATYQSRRPSWPHILFLSLDPTAMLHRVMCTFSKVAKQFTPVLVYTTQQNDESEAVLLKAMIVIHHSLQMRHTVQPIDHVHCQIVQLTFHTHCQTVLQSLPSTSTTQN